MRGATPIRWVLICRAYNFNPRSPCGERRYNIDVEGERTNFNPRSPCGERPDNNPARQEDSCNFNPRSPCGERPQADQPKKVTRPNFNPRSPCGERHVVEGLSILLTEISIHAPRAGSDFYRRLVLVAGNIFQSTLPVRGATWMGNEDCYAKAFQSTLPVRGATGRFDSDDKGSQHFNPRSPCGERPISPKSSTAIMTHFNPRSPCGERRLPNRRINYSTKISIHAPRAGSDSATSSGAMPYTYFNPRSPCGERLAGDLVYPFLPLFQSTLPVRGATLFVRVYTRLPCVFQSTLPVRGATMISFSFCLLIGISIHAPRAGSDQPHRRPCLINTDFNPRSPCGERLQSRLHSPPP